MQSQQAGPKVSKSWANKCWGWVEAVYGQGAYVRGSNKWWFKKPLNCFHLDFDALKTFSSPHPPSLIRSSHSPRISLLTAFINLLWLKSRIEDEYQNKPNHNLLLPTRRLTNDRLMHVCTLFYDEYNKLWAQNCVYARTRFCSVRGYYLRGDDNKGKVQPRRVHHFLGEGEREEPGNNI